jgi:predicted MPP superfamily phosphohydrolase
MQEYKIKIALTTIAFMLFIDIYAWHGVKHILEKKGKQVTYWGRIIWWSIPIILITLFTIGYLFIELETNGKYRVYIAASIFIIYLSKFTLMLFVLVDDLRRAFLWIKKTRNFNPSNNDNDDTASETVSVSKKISRSQFLSQAGTLTAAAPLILLTKGVFKGGYDYRIHHVPLYLKNLPPAFEGLKIAQLSDIHTGSLLDQDAVKKGMDMMMAEKPDVIFFTGDLVNNETKEAYNYANMFSEIKAPMGIFSIYGNHDYGDYISWETKAAKQKNLDDLAKLHFDMGWHLMRNEHLTLDKGGKRIGLIGVENWGNKGRFQKFGDIEQAVKNMPDVPVKLLLSHDPSHFDDIVSIKHPDIDVTFSGHTHGMQFGFEFGKIKWSPSQYIYPHWAGLYEVNGSRLYVNRGFGFLGYPGRVGIMPEITIFELKKFDKLS